ncbi:MIP/aquaporin family protein [Segniliparus rugosus]|uniref:Glycerol uptake facilitator protein n=1 Tax=Segniliparus rugosus (strain ATCC BAA-974 / DSM 45345 / CCUG 50838 / CIP 108380 / JCM 13579 / CDC 945) TaxID=679197 RepID=E5XTM7_SEGRC|nr:MIP/aquaporin family protein [Segniliparus rugosus]EFV12289.1 hypothetical protein HMPREF9336_02849 [Segniliparus rugosus ATCC BAA-974]
MPQVFLAEFLGTAALLLIGCAAVANAVLAGTKGVATGIGWLTPSVGWGMAVFAGAGVGFHSGAYLNPALVLAQVVRGRELTAGVAPTLGNVAGYVLAEFLGAFVGSALAWLAFKSHFDGEPDPAKKLGVFATGPQIRAPLWNLVTEAVATFLLVVVIFHFAVNPAGFGPLYAGLLVLGIAVGLGGPTGYAINPARDLAPRVAHAILPIPGKGPSDWGYSWIPVLGPLLGGGLGGLVCRFLPYLPG